VGNLKGLPAAAAAVRSATRRASVQVRLAALLAVVAAAWFAVDFNHPRGPLVLLWLPSPLSAAIAVMACWQTARTLSLPAATRRFWAHFGIVAALVGLGSTSEINDALGGAAPAIQHIGPFTLVSYAGATLVIMWAMCRLPLGASGRGDMLRVGLDATTVMLATGVFMWHYQTRTLLAVGTDRSSSLVGSGIVMVFALVAVFAVVKVMLSGRAFVDKGSLRLLALGLIIGSLGSLPQGLLLDKPYLVCSQATVPAVMLCATAASVRQRRGTAAIGRRGAAAVRPPFSVLPYLAVAVVDGLLLWSAWLRDDQRVVAAGAVALTGLVVVRQLTAFQDNDRLLARLDHNATHDALTQLPNRALFADRLRAALATSGPDRRVTVVLIDLDDFKPVNDSLGHGAGDAVLVAVAQRLIRSIRPGDTVARLGGDEFVVLLDDAAPGSADYAVQRIAAAFASPVLADGQDLLIRASLGVAHGCSGDDADELLRRADVAMYTAKRGGSGSPVRFVPGMVTGMVDGARLGAELSQAIIEGQLFLLYQPIVAFDGDRLLGIEALVRWAHPVRGNLTPSSFIPVAERNGLIVPLGKWVVGQACRQFADWLAGYGGNAPEVLNVNVSARQLREPQFVDEVGAALADAGLAPHQLTLEITETAMLDLGPSVRNLEELRRLGVRIALDDFGTGQSTLSLLQDCPVDEIKLDRSFTQADPAPDRRSIAYAVIHLTRALDLQAVAEGVETPQQADRLRAWGYQAAQGFHFGPPMPVDEVAVAFLRETPSGSPQRVSHT
jgi:diguanylate cyclase (GGDEF)-like protein